MRRKHVSPPPGTIATRRRGAACLRVTAAAAERVILTFTQIRIFRMEHALDISLHLTKCYNFILEEGGRVPSHFRIFLNFFC